MEWKFFIFLFIFGYGICIGSNCLIMFWDLNIYMYKKLIVLWNVLNIKKGKDKNIMNIYIFNIYIENKCNEYLSIFYLYLINILILFFDLDF